MEISNVGMIVRPRTELLLAKRTSVGQPTHYRRVATGIEHLDVMLGGGLLASSATLLLGFSGSGKTLLGLHFLDEGAKKQEPGLYFGFYEPPERLIEAAQHVGLASFRENDEAGLISIMWQPALKFGLDALAEKLLQDVRARKVRRVVIDGIDGFRQGAAFPERTIRFVTALTNELRALDVTVLVTEETLKLFGPEVEIRVQGLSALVDNIILLEYMDVGAELKRLLSVIKQRGAGHDANVRELCITDKGIELAPDGTTANEILQGMRTPRDPRRPRGT
jgi:circadian clock protein KaiC